MTTRTRTLFKSLVVVSVDKNAEVNISSRSSVIHRLLLITPGYNGHSTNVEPLLRLRIVQQHHKTSPPDVRLVRPPEHLEVLDAIKEDNVVDRGGKLTGQRCTSQLE